jgi:hypothetical protein
MSPSIKESFALRLHETAIADNMVMHDQIIDGAVLKVLENLIAFVDEVNDRPVGNPKRRL